MATVSFSPNIRSQVDIGEMIVSGETLAEAMAELFSECPALKSYLLNDGGSVRKHVAFVVNGDQGDSWEAVSMNLPPVFCVGFG